MNSPLKQLFFRTLLSISVTLIAGLPLFGQIAVGQWRDHLPYTDGVQVADAGDRVYAASEFGLFQYYKESGDVIRMSKVTGLSDIGYAAIAWSESNNTLIIAYENTNIDLVQNGQIINVPDIKDKPILGNKTIHKVHVKGDLAYLACGFAVVVLDIVKHEIKDTYYIGPQGISINVYDVATSDDKIFAVTESGAVMANINNINLANFENWTEVPNLPQADYRTGTWFNNRLYVGRNVDNASDTVYVWNNGNVNIFPDGIVDEVRYLESTDDRLLLTTNTAVIEFDNSLRLRVVFEYPGPSAANPASATIDEDYHIWIADRFKGLVRVTPAFGMDVITVNGPRAVENADFSIWDGRCYVASGSVTATWANGYNNQGVFTFLDDEWGNINQFSFPETNGFSDFVRVEVDPLDSRRFYASGYGRGIAEYYDNQLVTVYDTINSPMEDLDGAPGNIRCVGVRVDRRNGNLWVSSGGTSKQIYVKEPTGTWYAYEVPGLGGATLADIVIDDIGQKWIMAPRGVGLVVFNDGETLEFTGDDQSRRLTQNAGNGNLASNEVFCLEADLDGEIWVGTNNGISVFYSPESVFSGNDFDSQQILVEQDGYVGYLLENESVTAIAVDGANRKWVGTSNAGVFLLSEDGTEEVFHFTTENSPLYSDQITAIGVDQLSGEVFIGTDKGIISYRGTATWGTPEFEKEDVYAYPNPVEPDYDGLIAIKGLVRDADVKIADVAGNVVFATTAEGGQAIWDGNKQTGGRAQSGVYLVFASNEDGKETFVTKILFIN
jgi:streptogramin lyase